MPDGLPVLLVGTGLTMVDVALTVASGIKTSTLVALSRHGALPSVHAPGVPAPADPPELPAGRVRLAHVMEALTLQAGRLGSWEAAVDSMRPVTPDVWRRLSSHDRREFLRRYARRWDVLRHRMAPEVGVALARLRETGRLKVRSGTVGDARRDEHGIQVCVDGSWQRFGSVVNCTGPQTNLRRLGDPLLDHLLATGVARPDALRLGLDTDASGVLVDATGVRTRGLWAVGPVRRGGLWESTAMPEIRDQAAAVARGLMLGLQAVEQGQPGPIGRRPW